MTTRNALFQFFLGLVCAKIVLMLGAEPLVSLSSFLLYIYASIGLICTANFIISIIFGDEASGY